MKSLFPHDIAAKIRFAAEDSAHACGLTHPLYRYPASMSPALARELILNLTKPGDTILDPFCGGGTTAIESLSNGRKVICSDINPLAGFVTIAKAWPLKESSLAILEEWFTNSVERLKRMEDVRIIPLLTRTGKQYSPQTHGLLLTLRDLAARIPGTPVRRIALLITLQVGKLCFDCRELPPSPNVLITKLVTVYNKAIQSIKSYSSECYKWQINKKLSDSFKIYNCSIHDLPLRLMKSEKKITLLLTSPPYPGIHVLYNRWQIHGRGETDLPYNLLHLHDGQSASFYTFGDRKEENNKAFFWQIGRAFQNLKSVLEKSTLLAQVISFPDPKRQLCQYRKLMDEAGYKEILLDRTDQNIIQREIPNRRWYTKSTDKVTSAREYIIIHKPK